MIIGIDPGNDGAIVALYDDETARSWPMPTLIRGNTRHVDGLKAWQTIDGAVPLDQHADIWIEDVHAMPGQGVVSMFNFGHALGAIEGISSTLGRVHFVRPQVWKEYHQLTSGAGKDASRLRVIGLGYLDQLPELKLKGQGQATADALLIAIYGRAQG